MLCHDLSRRAWRAYEVFQATVHYRNSQSFIYGMNLNNGVSGVMKIDMTSVLAECTRHTSRLWDLPLVTHCHKVAVSIPLKGKKVWTRNWKCCTMDLFSLHISPFNKLCLEHFHFIDIVKGYAKLVFQTNCRLPLGRLRQYIYIEGQRLSYSALQCDGWLLGRHLGPFEEHDSNGLFQKHNNYQKSTKSKYWNLILILPKHLSWADQKITI